MKNQIIILMTVFLAFSCGNNATVNNAAEKKEVTTVTLTDAQHDNAKIVIGNIVSKFISSTVNATGKLIVPPQNLISVSAPLGGYLKSTKLMPGMQVRKGEVLAILEDQQFIQLQQDYLTAKAKFSFNESEFKRQKELNENKAASDKVFEQTKANYQTEYVLMKSLEEKLRLIGLNPQKITADNINRTVSIVSPIDGFVSTVNVNTGKYINPSDVLFELVNPNNVLLELTVYEKDVDKLAVGQKLTAVTNSNPDKKYVLSTSLISRNLSNNAVQILCTFEKPVKELLPGMFMTAQIDLTGAEVAALPEEAIVRYGNKQYVFLETGDKRYEMKEVKIGSAENGFTAIEDLEGLEKVVIKGAYTLLMALKNVSED